MKKIAPLLIVLGFAPFAFGQVVIKTPDKGAALNPASTLPNTSRAKNIPVVPDLPKPAPAAPKPAPDSGRAIFGKTANSYVAGLQDSDPGRRVKALFALGRLGQDAQASVPEMLKTLQDERDLSVRWAYRWALRQIDRDGTLQALGR
jgi:hypothetical protein